MVTLNKINKSKISTVTYTSNSDAANNSQNNSTDSNKPSYKSRLKDMGIGAGITAGVGATGYGGYKLYKYKESKKPPILERIKAVKSEAIKERRDSIDPTLKTKYKNKNRILQRKRELNKSRNLDRLLEKRKKFLSRTRGANNNPTVNNLYQAKRASRSFVEAKQKLAQITKGFKKAKLYGFSFKRDLALFRSAIT